MNYACYGSGVLRVFSGTRDIQSTKSASKRFTDMGKDINSHAQGAAFGNGSGLANSISSGKQHYWAIAGPERPASAYLFFEFYVAYLSI
jgi:hypothetical protein